MTKKETSIGKLGRYQVYEEIGRGGFSIVYRAENPALKRPIAIKLMLPALFQDPQAIEHFIREARTTAGLAHDHIVRVYDLEEEQGRLFMALEYLPGGDLHRWAEAHGRLSFRQAAGLIGEIAEALDYAHGQGLVHGDVKPGNILLTEDGKAKLTDFGVLRAIEDSGVTSAEMTRGTPYYISPEQAEGGRSTPKSDLYSLAVVAYELFTGRVPFEGETPLTIYLKHVREAPPPASQANPLITPQLQAVLHKSLEKDPEERYPDCRAFARALREAVAATEAEQYQLLVRRAQAALAAHEADAARPLIENALQIMPEEVQARALLADLQAQERAQRNYQAAAEALTTARQSAEKLVREKSSIPDPQGLLARLAPPPPPAWKVFLARWRIAALTAVGLFLVGFIFSLGYTGYVEIGSNRNVPDATQQKATLVAMVRTSTPTFTPTFTPTPTYTPTQTFTPTPIPLFYSFSPSAGIAPNRDYDILGSLITVTVGNMFLDDSRPFDVTIGSITAPIYKTVNGNEVIIRIPENSNSGIIKIKKDTLTVSSSNLLSLLPLKPLPEENIKNLFTGSPPTYNLNDNGGFLWDILFTGNYSGVILNGTVDAFDNGGLFSILVGNTEYLYSPTLDPKIVHWPEGDELYFASELVNDSFLISRRIFIPTTGDGQFARLVMTVTNKTTNIQTITIKINSNLGSDGNTNRVSQQEKFLITDDQDNSQDPVVSHIVGSNSFLKFNSDDLSYTWQITLSGNETIRVMVFLVQTITRAQAQQSVDELLKLPKITLTGLTEEELSQVINFELINTPNASPTPSVTPSPTKTP